MQTDTILWHTLSKNTDDPVDNLSKVDFTMSRQTETYNQIFNEGADITIVRLKKAVKERGYDFVNVDWNRKVLYIKKHDV